MSVLKGIATLYRPLFFSYGVYMAVKLSNDEVQLENIEQSLIEMVLHKEVPSIITYSAYRELVDDLTKVLSTVKPALRALTESTMDSLKEAL